MRRNKDREKIQNSVG